MIDKLLPLLPAVCALALAGFLFFVYALCKTAAMADRWMDDLHIEPADDGEFLGG